MGIFNQKTKNIKLKKKKYYRRKSNQKNRDKKNFNNYIKISFIKIFKFFKSHQNKIENKILKKKQ